jgi:hypothetical protein
MMIAIWSFIGFLSVVKPPYDSSIANRVLPSLALFIVLSEVLEYLFVYCELLQNCVIERRIWKTTVQPYAEINYVGPRTDRWAKWSSRAKYVEIRSGDGKKIVFSPKQRDAFVADIHKHLPDAVFFFDEVPATAA